MTPQIVLFRIPDTLIYWPWPRRINPHYDEVKPVSEAWFQSFKAFEPEAQRAYDRCDCKHFRTVCDLINLLFVFDEYTDNVSVKVVRQYADIVMDAIRNPLKARPTGEVVLGVIAQEYNFGFWVLGVKTASSTSQKHFSESFERYTYSVVRQAEIRHKRYMPSIQDYLDIRRLTAGADPSFSMIGLGYDLPEEVFRHPTVLAVQGLGRDLIILDNDLASYNKEQALEEYPHNIIVCVMKELECDLHAALLWVEDLHRSTRNKFLTLWTEIPSWGPETDAIASLYLHGIANWVRGSESWNFEGGRYFGSNGKAVQQHRMVTLIPKQLSASEPLLIHTYQSA
ncbi:terpenoid synthase [Desarmillaria ectypa]|nr:terpenoid synthase [Desarmillaria ectypa]